MRISDWSSDVCSSDLLPLVIGQRRQAELSAQERKAIVDLEIDTAQLERIEIEVRKIDPVIGAGDDGDVVTRSLVVPEIALVHRLLTAEVCHRALDIEVVLVDRGPESLHEGRLHPHTRTQP